MKIIAEKSAVIAAATMIKRKLSCEGSVCDLGSRDEILSKYLPDYISYQGVDIYPTGDRTIYSNIDQEICFHDEAFDIVVAIDVLEHTNDIERAVSELLRITKSSYIINLPNELYFRYRVRLLLGIISNKFKINLHTMDRHRWFFTLENAKRLAQQSALNDTKYEIYPFYQKSLRSGSIALILRLFGLHSLAANSFFIIGTKT